LKELLRAAFTQFEKNRIPLVDAEILLAHLLGVSRKEIHSQGLEIADEQLQKITNEYNDLLSQRILGRPVQYITGSAPFRYLDLEVGEGVLIATLKNLKVSVVAVEKSEKASEFLNKNIAKYDLPIRVVVEDVQTALPGVKADLVVTNPPYIPNDESLPKEVENYEPEIALRGGKVDGMQVPKLFIEAAARLLKPDGILIMEHHENQSDLVKQALKEDFKLPQTHADLTGRDRFTSARKR